MECSVQERVVEEQTATFRPALGLAPHHQLTAIGSLQTLGENRGLSEGGQGSRLLEGGARLLWWALKSLGLPRAPLEATLWAVCDP